MHLGSMFTSNCNDTVQVSDAFCVHPHKPEAVTIVFKCS